MGTAPSRNAISNATTPSVSSQAPPWKQDGWERVEIPQVSKWMLSRYDGEGDGHNSRAVSFRRIKRR